MISVIIPSYRNPKYLDLCLYSLLKGSINNNDIVVIIDGHLEESKNIINKYKNNEQINFIQFEDNKGMQMALNIGVYNAKSNKLLIINDDNVMPDQWDEILEDEYSDESVITINQIETKNNMFNFHVKSFGKNVENFDYEKFINYEKSIRKNYKSKSARIFPFLINKKYYMIVNGFDTIYNSPFVCDWDFFLKLEMLDKLKFYRTYKLNIYHFGGKATKSGNEGKRFIKGEISASKTFKYKWGFYPQNDPITNSKLP